MTNGKLTAYVGAMGAGKTKKLIAVHDKLVSEGKNVIVFMHGNSVKRDGHDDMVVARNGDSVQPAHPIDSLADLITFEAEQFDAVLIDEIQFFDDEYTIYMLDALLMTGVDVYVFGLDVTSDDKTFGLMGEILTHADEVKKLKVRCHKCGEPARISEFVGGQKEGEVHVGDLDEYKPTCRHCFYTNPTKFMEEPVKQEPEKDEYYEINLHGDGFMVEMGFYKSDLDKAGYTINEVRDLNSQVGVMNFLEDMGIPRIG